MNYRKSVRRMFKDKRGGIPVIEELWQGILKIFDIIPSPIKFLIFLFIVINLVGALLTPMFQVFGYHCDEDSNLWKMETWDIITNIKLIREISRLGDLISTTLGDIEGIYRSVPQPIPLLCGADLVSVNSSLVRCTNCSSVTVSLLNKRCTSDGFPKTDFAFLDFKSKIQCVDRQCGPLSGEIYNLTAHAFQCTIGNCLTETIDEKVERVNDIILKSGGSQIFTVDDETRYEPRNFVNLVCNEQLQPRLMIFGLIDIFDFEIWLLLTVLGIIFYFANNIFR